LITYPDLPRTARYGASRKSIESASGRAEFSAIEAKAVGVA